MIDYGSINYEGKVNKYCSCIEAGDGRLVMISHGLYFVLMVALRERRVGRGHHLLFLRSRNYYT